MHPADRVVINTAIIYIKAVLTVVLSLYTTRITLDALGADDFGLFNLIGGVVVMLSFLNAAMTVSTQRYISHSLGENQIEKTKIIFANSVILHLVIGLALVILFETVGLYFVNYVLDIDLSKKEIANILFQFIIISTFISIISVPYDAIVTAHENMLFVAIVGILDIVLKFFIALYLYYTPFDRLLTYGLLLMVESIFIRSIKTIYTKRKYIECIVSYTKEYNKMMIFDLFSFAGWNTFGALCSIARNQGLTIIFNIFFGTIINAAYAIAYQLAGYMTFFSSTLLQVINPQIMKNEGSNNRYKMLRISMLASKMSYFLLIFIAIPFLFEAKAILDLWLNNKTPEHTVIFCNLLLVSIIVNQLTIGLQSAIQATGEIKHYQVIVGSLLLTNLPISYLLLYLGFPIYSPLVCFIIIEFISCLVRLYLLKIRAGLSIREYIENVFKREISPTLFSIIVCLVIVSSFEMKCRYIITFILSTIVFSISTYFVGLSNDERQKLNTICLKFFNKLKK